MPCPFKCSPHNVDDFYGFAPARSLPLRTAALRFNSAGTWGRKMRNDLSNGVTILVGQCTIDPKRMCIVGASYSGYVALAGVALQHSVPYCRAGPARYLAIW